MRFLINKLPVDVGELVNGYRVISSENFLAFDVPTPQNWVDSLLGRQRADVALAKLACVAAEAGVLVRVYRTQNGLHAIILSHVVPRIDPECLLLPLLRRMGAGKAFLSHAMDVGSFRLRVSPKGSQIDKTLLGEFGAVSVSALAACRLFVELHDFLMTLHSGEWDSLQSVSKYRTSLYKESFRE